MAHHTKEEALEAIPKWIRIINFDFNELQTALKDEDWSQIHRQCVNLKWDITNLAGRSLDMAEHTKGK